MFGQKSCKKRTEEVEMAGKKKSRTVSKTTYHKTKCACVLRNGKCAKRKRK